MSLIDFRLSMPYHYDTKVHFTVYNSKSSFSFYVFYINL